MRRRLHAELLQLFSSPIRLIIFDRLGRKPRSAGELARELPVGRTAVVQHLRLLAAAGLVTAAPEGRRRVYRVIPAGLKPLQDWLDGFKT
jgi:DNA-binding transcriptional ArsR family regulator